MPKIAALIVVLVAFAPGCRCEPEEPTGAAAVSAALSGVPPRALPSAPPMPPPPMPLPAKRNWALPSGPVLAVLAGQGVGPIRIGATIATIERLMAAPCDVKTRDVCRYIGRAVEFQLENGAVKLIAVQRAGRPAGKDNAGRDAEYGFFHGAIPPDLQLGMVPFAIQEHLGPPKSVERRDAPGAADRVEIHHYPGLRVEYDRIENGNLVAGAFVLFKEPAAGAGSAK
jgi:hypothetical protein